MIHSLFNALANEPGRFLDARTGIEFEDRIQAFMRNSMHYNRLQCRDIDGWENLKRESLLKSNDDPISNHYDIDSSYIYQPNGSQNYPDFLVFETGEVVCIEVKYTRQPRPVWNSGLPRPNGFYVLGRPATRDVTFFRGCDVVSREEGESMHAFFDELRQIQVRFNRENMSEQRKGFAVYIRKAFEQKREYNIDADIDYYNSPEREQLQQNVLSYFC